MGALVDGPAVPHEHDLDDRAGDPVVVQQWLGAPALSYARRPATVLDVLERAVRRWPGRTCMIDVDGTAVSFQQLADSVEAAAAALRGRGLAPGQSVAVASGNSLELAVAVFACARARLILVGLNVRLAPQQWEYVLRHSGAPLVLGSAEHLAALRTTPAGRHAEPLADVLREAGPVSWSYATGGSQQPAQDETYAVVYTSGTTGRPKASQVVHRCSVHSAMSYQRVLGLTPDDVTAVLFPLHYISAMHAHVLPAMLAGAASVLVDTTSPAAYVELLARHRVSWAYAVPSWWRLCLRAQSFRHLPALTRLAAGGAPFSADLVTALRERLPGVRLHDVYGLSETHSPACIATDEVLRARPGSVGRPLDCMRAEVRAGDAVLPAGQAGALWLQGSLVTTGYAGDPAGTAEAIVDGWFCTGDVARTDDEGHLWILDRTKDMINRGGNKIYSVELEDLLRRHPAIEDAAVVGVPEALAGEAVAAFLVCSAPVEAAAVRAWVRTGLAEHAVPRRVEVLEALPRNALGKTDKSALRARAAAARER